MQKIVEWGSDGVPEASRSSRRKRFDFIDNRMVPLGHDTAVRILTGLAIQQARSLQAMDVYEGADRLGNPCVLIMPVIGDCLLIRLEL